MARLLILAVVSLALNVHDGVARVVHDLCVELEGDSGNRLHLAVDAVRVIDGVEAVLVPIELRAGVVADVIRVVVDLGLAGDVDERIVEQMLLQRVPRDTADVNGRAGQVVGLGVEVYVAKLFGLFGGNQGGVSS